MKHYLSFERLGLIESFRRFWVRCKSSCYWDLELSHSMKSESHHPFVPINYSLVLLKRRFSVLGTIDDRVFYFPPKNTESKNWCSKLEFLSLRFAIRIFGLYSNRIFGQHPVSVSPNPVSDLVQTEECVCVFIDRGEKKTRTEECHTATYDEN